MIEKIKEVAKLQNELKEKHGVSNINVHLNTTEAHVFDLEVFLDVVGDAPIITESIVDDYFTHKITSRVGGVELFKYLTETEYKEYKKSRSPQATKKNVDTL